MDKQIIEAIGRNYLVNELLQAGLEVAMPLRDHGIDLIAYADTGEGISAFTACPIQMKAASDKSFVINRKYEKFPNLLHAFVWNIGIGSSRGCEIYALTHNEAVLVGDDMGYTRTLSWENGTFVTSSPSQKILGLLLPYRMTPQLWWQKITRLQSIQNRLS